jgi:hypothetical protein
MNRFYVLKPAGGISFGTKWAYAELVQPVNRGQTEECPHCGGIVSGMEWLPPHKVKLSSAKPEKWGDFLWGAGFKLIVSARFKEIYDREDISGISRFYPPIEIVRTGKLKTGVFTAPLPEYRLVHFPWGGANQDDIASQTEFNKPGGITCQYHRGGVVVKKQKRIILEKGSWDGADIFIPRGSPVMAMVSEKFKLVAEEYELTNIWMIPAEKYGYDSSKIGNWYTSE